MNKRKYITTFDEMDAKKDDYIIILNGEKGFISNIGYVTCIICYITNDSN